MLRGQKQTCSPGRSVANDTGPVRADRHAEGVKGVRGLAPAEFRLDGALPFQLEFAVTGRRPLGGAQPEDQLIAVAGWERQADEPPGR